MSIQAGGEILELKNDNKDKIQYYSMGENLFARGYAYSDYEDDTLDYDLIEKCPLCGSYISGAQTKQPYQLVLSTKKKIGDFTFGLFHFIVVSANFKDKYEKSGLTGIKEFRKIQKVRVRKEIVDIELYAIVIERIDVRLEPIISDSGEKAICKLCNPYGKIYYGEKGLKMNLNTQSSTPDIFMTYTRGTGTFCTQKFVDFCHSNGFTNFDKQICRIEDYRSGIYGKAAEGW